MRLAVANWVQRVLGVKREDGSLGIVTSDLGVRAQEADGRDVVLLSQGDGFDLVYGQKDGPYTVLQLSPSTLLKLAWFVLWRWWFRGTWCGWKLSAWQWSAEVQIDEANAARSAVIQKRRNAQRSRMQ